MFYEPDKNDHGLPHTPFKSCCIPRPIGWISTLAADGAPNLAPFSQFQNLSFDPPSPIAGDGRAAQLNTVSYGEGDRRLR